MNENKLSLLLFNKLISYEKINDNFLKAKCYVLALGKNMNNSYFSKENVDRAYPSLSFVPVIGNITQDENGVSHLGGHDYTLDANNGFKLKSKCVPFGVAIPSDKPQYEEVIEDNGNISQYLVCDILLWIGRYPELKEVMYNNEIYFGQSMEIIYSKSELLKEDTDYTNIIDFSFDALCMLGKSDDKNFNVTPCFPNAFIIPSTYSIDYSANTFSTLMFELKEELRACFNMQFDNKGGKNLNQDNNTLDENKVDDTISINQDTDINDNSNFSVNDNENVENSRTESINTETISDDHSTLYATYLDKKALLVNALMDLSKKAVTDNINECDIFYDVIDFDDNYVYVCEFFSSCMDEVYGRFTYSYDEQTNSVSITDSFEEMAMVWLTLQEKKDIEDQRVLNEQLNNEFNSYKETHSYENNEFNELKDYKNNKEKAEHDNAVQEIYQKYSDKLGEFDDFNSLFKNAEQYSLTDLEKECIYLFGLHSVNQGTIDKNENSLKFTVNDTAKNVTDDDVYGGVFSKYLKK